MLLLDLGNPLLLCSSYELSLDLRPINQAQQNTHDDAHLIRE
jgi:hypothetical protein